MQDAQTEYPDLTAPATGQNRVLLIAEAGAIKGSLPSWVDLVEYHVGSVPPGVYPVWVQD